MKSQWMRMLGAATAVMLAAFGLCGCNDDDGGSSSSGDLDGYFASHPFLIDTTSGSTGNGVISINPSVAQVNEVGGKVLFKASGGDGSYSWEVLDKSIGSVSGSGSQGTYTALKVGSTSVMVNDNAGNWASASISGSASTLSASANPSTLESDEKLSVLHASGGQPPYAWSLSSGSGAIVGADTGASVVYRRDTPGDNVLTVTDSLGNRASVLITQP